jgi:hypothetical protein
MAAAMQASDAESLLLSTPDDNFIMLSDEHYSAGRLTRRWSARRILLLKYLKQQYII